MAAWDHIQEVSPKHLIKGEHACSVTPAYNWGVWEGSLLTPFITRESRTQSPKAIVAIDWLLSLVRWLVVPKVIQMTQHYLPYNGRRRKGMKLINLNINQFLRHFEGPISVLFHARRIPSMVLNMCILQNSLACFACIAGTSKFIFLTWTAPSAFHETDVRQ